MANPAFATALALKHQSDRCPPPPPPPLLAIRAPGCVRSEDLAGLQPIRERKGAAEVVSDSYFYDGIGQLNS